MAQSTHLSRRNFVKSVTATGFGLGAAMTAGATTPTGSNCIPRKAKNLILMVSDGMNNGTFSAVNHWLNLTENRDSEWMQLYKDEIAQRRLVETSCADSLVTDSAAASSAWGIGQRVNLHTLNITPNGSKPMPLAMLAKSKGKSAGMVSTARVTHATPAGFAVNVSHRDEDMVIADQYLERKIDVLLGGGDKSFSSAIREDAKDVYSGFLKEGYQIVRTKKELQSIPNRGPLLGVFAEDHMPFQIDRENQPKKYAEVPSLEEMTEVALARLNTNPNGFVLQIEAGRVDHAAHANDAAGVIHDQMEFDRTVGFVRKFAEKNGETMVIVTTDHGTGGFMVNRSEEGYAESQEHFLRLVQCKGSFEELNRRIDETRLDETLVPAIESIYGFKLKDADRSRVLELMKQPDEKGLYGGNKVLSAALKPILSKYFSVSWTCHHHTADLVEMAMFGPGSDALPGYIENWQVHGVIRECLGI